jgi:4-nitrophenyl phosphatase
MKFTVHHPLQALILDMDGVLWRGAEAIGCLSAIFAEIARRGWKVTLATNNATRSAAQYVEKLASFEVTIEPQQVVTSAEATALYLREKFPQGGPVYLLGEEGLASAVEKAGFFPADDHCPDDSILAVISSMDRSLTYAKLRRATLLIRAGVPFLGTNPDRTFPTPEGLVPGAGAILAALEAATYRQPLIMGKPQPEIYRAALLRMGVSPSETLVVGDRPDTDIAGGQALGCFTALLLSGVTSEACARAWQPPPDLIAADLSSLLTLL